MLILLKSFWFFNDFLSLKEISMIIIISSLDINLIFNFLNYLRCFFYSFFYLYTYILFLVGLEDDVNNLLHKLNHPNNSHRRQCCSNSRKQPSKFRDNIRNFIVWIIDQILHKNKTKLRFNDQVFPCVHIILTINWKVYLSQSKIIKN